MKKEYFILVLILLTGLALRVWGINFGLPFLLHQDELIVVNHAMAYGAGDLNPHFFAIPPLASYLLFILYGAFFLIGRLFGIFQSAEGFALGFLKDPTMFFTLGRLFIGAIPGALCVLFTSRLYKRLFDSQAGALFAAAVMALSFINVADSHYIYTDMLMCLFIIMAVIRITMISDRPCIKNYVYAGILLGIATGTKYNAAILVVPYLLAHLLACRKKFLNRNLFLGIAASGLAFIIVNPFSVLDFRFFISSVLGQAGASWYVGWWHHISYSLHEGVGVFLMICGLSGMIILCLKNTAKAAVLFSFPIVFYIHLALLSQHFPRYVLPLVPFLSIAAGYFLFEFLIPNMRKKLLADAVIFLSIFFLVPITVKSVKANMLFASQDTRIEAARWAEDNIGEKHPIAADHTFFRPFIYQNEKQLKHKYSIIDKQKGLKDIKEKKLQMMLESPKGNKGYYLYFLNKNPEAQGQFLSTMPAIAFDYNSLKDKGIKYVTANYYDRQNGADLFYEQLKNTAALVYSISPYYDGSIRFTYDPIATTCMPVMSKELYSRKRQGPAIEIYKLK